MAKRSLPHASTKYWVDMILTTIPPLECRRFDCEREAAGRKSVPVFRTHARLLPTPTHPKGGRSSSIGAKQNEARAKHGNSAEQRR